jgi:hypothetical protein
MGRPKVYCSLECRREAEAMRAELPALELELAEARIKAEHWSNQQYWQSEARRLELAIQSHRLRLGEMTHEGDNVA